jgi:hypothetical protein
MEIMRNRDTMKRIQAINAKRIGKISSDKTSLLKLFGKFETIRNQFGPKRYSFDADAMARVLYDRTEKQLCRSVFLDYQLVYELIVNMHRRYKVKLVDGMIPRLEHSLQETMNTAIRK